jgi:hypothetical protein
MATQKRKHLSRPAESGLRRRPQVQQPARSFECHRPTPDNGCGRRCARMGVPQQLHARTGRCTRVIGGGGACRHLPCWTRRRGKLCGRGTTRGI